MLRQIRPGELWSNYGQLAEFFSSKEYGQQTLMAMNIKRTMIQQKMKTTMLSAAEQDC